MPHQPSPAHYLLGGAQLPESVETSRPIGLTVDTLWGSLSLNLGGGEVGLDLWVSVRVSSHSDRCPVENL